jgi:hypothetical protein
MAASKRKRGDVEMKSRTLFAGARFSAHEERRGGAPHRGQGAAGVYRGQVDCGPGVLGQ